MPRRSTASGPLGPVAVLEQVARRAPLAATLDILLRSVEAAAPGLRSSVLLLRGTQLYHGAAPSLPASYTQAIDGIEIGPGVGSCGAAAATGKPVIVGDVATHPNWEPFRGIALPHGIRACWSTPILSSRGEVLGTFAIYYGEPREPSEAEMRIIDDYSHLAAIAIEVDRDEAERARLAREESARAEAERERVRLRLFFEQAPFAAALLEGPEHRYALTNEKYLEIAQRLVPLGRSFREVFPELAQDPILKIIDGVYATGERFRAEEYRLELVRKGQVSPAWFDFSLHPFHDHDGSIRGVFAIGIEITDRVKARMELESMHRQLAASERLAAVGSLVAGVAHEIRTPLTYIQTNLDLSERALAKAAGGASDDVPAYLADAREGVQRVLRIVEDLRRFHRSGGMDRVPVDLKDVVAEAVALYVAVNRGRPAPTLDLASSRKVPLGRVGVQQIVLNLLSNAVDAAEPTGGRVTVRTRDAEGGAELVVEDTGPGIRGDVAERVFDPFFTTKADGMGLGLSIVRRIVDDHGGTINFRTGPQGTTFVVRFPA